uniref:Protein RRP5 n=1 Tax=Aceria tosichella TaxID=561515 RepID=A0A6G1SLX7_9ACAR
MADPSENACVERLTPKTVPLNLMALGTVSDISSQQLKLQMTGGIVCLVDRFSISQPLTKYIKSQESSSKEGPRLIDLFQIGQQFACKIIDRQTRKGYADAQDIFATLDPSQLQEDNIPATLFSIPNVPIQCAILSVEDHGYRVDVGFKNLIGFLSYDEADDNGRRFHVGQVIRCSTKTTMDDETRIIQLTRSMKSLSKFTEDKCGQCALTPSCILPGSKGYLTVMKVQKDGLIVNFLDEFAGFVNMYHLKDDWQDPKSKYKIAEKIKCSVLYYNPTTKLFALSLRLKKFKSTLKRLINDYYVGQVVHDAKVEALYGVRSILFKISDLKAVANPRDALNEDVGTMGKDELHAALDSAYPDGSTHKCRIKSINYADLTLVLSLRQDFLEQTCVSIKELEPADFLEVTIKKYVKDGIIVCFGLNLRGIILNMHLKDYQSAKSYKRYPIGKTIKSRVLKVDTEKYPNKVYLTNKDELMDPDMTIIDTYDKSYRGITVNAVVIKLKHDGLIVELFNNVKGFIPRRFCSSTPIRTVGGLFQVGQIVSCTVYRVEPERQSLLLGIIPIEKIMAMKKERKLKRKQDKDGGQMQKKTKKKETVKSKNEQVEGNQTQDVAEAEEGEEEEDETMEDQEEEENTEDRDEEVPMEISQGKPKSRLQRSIEAKLREENIRKAEQALLNKNLPPQSITDFERNVLKSPDSADVWIKYSEFFLENVETEKARIVCRRALKTINFRAEKERLRIWLQLLKIEAKFGGTEQMRAIIEEAAQRNDKLVLYQRASQTLVACGELDEAEALHEKCIKLGRQQPNVWINYIIFLMEHRKDLNKARQLFDQVIKSNMPLSDLIHIRSRFAHLEFKYGDVERGKTLFENLLSENPKRMDIWKVYEDAIRKFGSRQMDSDEVRLQSEQILQRMATLKK